MESINESGRSNEYTENNVASPVKSELLPDYQDIFNTMALFNSREELMNWVRERAIPIGIVVVIGCSEIGNEKRLPRLVLHCERSGNYRTHREKILPEICGIIEDNADEVGDMSKGGKKRMVRQTGTKKCGCPFRLKGQYIAESRQWSLQVVCGYHNHAVATYLEGHAFVGRLSHEEESLVASMSSTHSRPKQILAALKKKFPNNKSTIKTIYNIRQKHKYVEHAGRSQMQYLLGKLEEHGYYQYTRRCQKTETVKEFFYAHPVSVQLLRAFPNVLLMDCTYKTNRYRLPLLEIVGVTSTNMTFLVACAYLDSEKEQSYKWALNVMKGLMDQKNLPSVIVTDREIALMNAIQVTFPNSRHFLCRWHINKNILVNCKKKFRTNDQWNSFHSAWNMIVLADTEDQYNELLKRFHEDYSNNQNVVKYVMTNWVHPYKERFINCWTNHVMHFDNTTTNRVEGTHAKLKKFLGSNTGNLETCWVKMHDLLETSINEVKASFEISINVIQHRYKSSIFQLLRGMISIAALEKVLDEMKSLGEYGVDPLLCGCVMRTKCGLPCAHEIDEYVRSSMPIPVEKIDQFWRKLDIEPLEGVDVEVGCDIDHRWLETWTELNVKFTNADQSARLLMLKRFREIVNPSTTLLIEPDVQIKMRGHPKNKKSKQATSTKRDKSAFEYVDSMNDSYSLFDGTQAEKKVIRRKKVNAANPSPTVYIDQIPSPFQAFVERIEDVKGDGHCGFRAIAGLMFGNEDSWTRVRSDILYELRKNPEEWKRCFLEVGRWEIIEETVYCYEETADKDHWFTLPEMGHVVASIYNVILVTLGGRYPATFLPLMSAPSSTPKCICIALVKMGQSRSLNHFVRVYLRSDHPLPPSTLQWRTNRNDCAIAWEDLIAHRTLDK